MDFTMEIDNPRKRCREEPDLRSYHLNERPVAKKARQSDTDASTRDSTPSLSESTPSTPASIDVDMDDTPQQAPAPEPKPQPRSGGTIISGWNQNQRSQYLRQGYPLAWMQRPTQVRNYLLFLLTNNY
jgi:hypothetical protein